jgi:hypothetical protein
LTIPFDIIGSHGMPVITAHTWSSWKVYCHLQISCTRYLFYTQINILCLFLFYFLLALTSISTFTQQLIYWITGKVRFSFHATYLEKQMRSCYFLCQMIGTLPCWCNTSAMLFLLPWFF